MVELAQSSTIYVKYDDSKAGNSLKDRLLGELKECLAITARAKRFQLKKGKSTAIADRKQFPLQLLFISLMEVVWPICKAT